MDFKKLSNNLRTIGGGLVLIAICWWLLSCSKSARGIADSISCLFSTGWKCETLQYHPAVLWIGISILVVGIVVRYSIPKQNQ